MDRDEHMFLQLCNPHSVVIWKKEDKIWLCVCVYRMLSDHDFVKDVVMKNETKTEQVKWG